MELTADFADLDADHLDDHRLHLHHNFHYDQIGVCGLVTPWNYPFIKLMYMLIILIIIDIV